MSSDRSSNASDLVMTQAELPPGVEAPSPAETRSWAEQGNDMSPELLQEIKRLADRVGGIERLKAIIDTLAGMPR